MSEQPATQAEIDARLTAIRNEISALSTEAARLTAIWKTTPSETPTVHEFDLTAQTELLVQVQAYSYEDARKRLSNWLTLDGPAGTYQIKPEDWEVHYNGHAANSVAPDPDHPFLPLELDPHEPAVLG